MKKLLRRCAALCTLLTIFVFLLCGCSRGNHAPVAASSSVAAETSASSEATAASADSSASPADTSGASDAASATSVDPSDASDAASAASVDGSAASDTSSTSDLDESSSYTSRDDVALYLHTYGHLPPNFLTKDEARSRGWDASKGNLGDVAPGMSIGGDRFGNREGLLPDQKGRQYYECDIDYDGGRRNAKRIVFSNDGLIFYTDDHYASFEQLY